MDNGFAAKKQLFDSHAHINYEKYTIKERAEIMERVEASPLAFVLDVGFDIESSRQAIADASDKPWCFAAVGVHPHYAESFRDEDLDTLRKLAGATKVVAFGEIGLDYYRDYSPRDMQRKAFGKQLRLALETGLPVIIHDRESGGDTLDILKKEGAFSDGRKAGFPQNPETGFSDARVLMHCFSGSAEMALEYVSLGCTISVAGPVTYKNNKKTVRVAAEVPLDRLLIETDAPYLTPEPFRGRQNEPVNVEYVARKVAELRGISYEELADATLANAKRFFGIE